MDNQYRAFGKTLATLRKKAKMTQASLAKASHLNRSYISLLECGSKQPSLQVVFTLAEALNISVSEFVTLIIRQRELLKHKQIATYVNSPTDHL